jgi:diphthamide biosynthesis methyltransferase
LILRFPAIGIFSTATMLYLVGLGLADETDITVRGLEIVKKAERVYLEAYTSILLVDTEKLVRQPFHIVTLLGIS